MLIFRVLEKNCCTETDSLDFTVSCTVVFRDVLIISGKSLSRRPLQSETVTDQLC